MKYIIAAGLFQIVLSIIFLLLNKQKDKTDYLLLILLCCIGWHLTTKFFIFTTVSNPAVTFRMHTFIQLAYGPLLYMYARKKNDLRFLPARLWYLFIPLIIVATLYSCTTVAIYSYPAYSEDILRLYNTIVFFPIVLSHIIFAFLSPAMASTPNEQKLIRSLKIVVSVIGLTEIALLIAGNINEEYNPYIRSMLYLLLGAMPILILRYKYVGVALAEVSYEALFTAEKEIAPRKLQLDTKRHTEIFSLLETTLTTKKLYKDEDLTLERLSATTGINRHHISETLNVFAQKSFYQYVNEYRVQEVIKLLDTPTPRAISLLAVAFECGFKTKASFNQYFKKIVGITPSEYLKNKKAAKAA